MNVRALALGALVGFVVAFLPACGAPKCGPQNCDGCCDAKGCVKKPTNNNNTTCGISGNTCADCAASGSTCNPATSACASTGGTGGGTGGGVGGGGGTACDGCQLPSGTCIPLSRTTITNCGKNAATCAACAAGENCTAGVCSAPDAGSVAIGSACTANADCAGIHLTPTDTRLHSVAYCKQAALDVTTTTGQGAAYTGGYCTKRCGFEEATTSSCAAGNTCSYVLGDLGEADNMCFKNCADDTECRADYFCLPYSRTTGICLPKTMLKTLADGGMDLPTLDAGPGFPGEAGATCAADTTCQPPVNGKCIGESLDAGYVGGACIAECTASLSNDAWCGTSGICKPAYAGDDARGPMVRWFCDRGCGRQTDGGIVGVCRDGYVCEGPGQFDTCIPKCTNSGASCPTSTPTCNATTGLCG